MLDECYRYSILVLYLAVAVVAIFIFETILDTHKKIIAIQEELVVLLHNQSFDQER